jgi:hypothetical protein
VTGAEGGNLDLYKTAIAASDMISDLTQLQRFVDNVNGFASAVEVDEGNGVPEVSIEAGGSIWFTIDMEYDHHQVSVLTLDNVDLRLDVFYPGYRCIEVANYSYDDSGQGVEVLEEHNTEITEPFAVGRHYFRVVELSDNAGLFRFHDSD